MDNVNIEKTSDKYQPSQELINIVKDNIEQKKSINIFTNEKHLVSVTEKQVSDLIYQSVTGFIATIAQGLAYGDGQYAVLGENNKLNSEVLKGFLLRMPIENQIEKFDEVLYQDLLNAAQKKCIQNEFGKLVESNNKVTIERSKVIEVKKNKNTNRALIGRIG